MASGGQVAAVGGASRVGKRIKMGLLRCIAVGWCMDTLGDLSHLSNQVRGAPFRKRCIVDGPIENR